MEGLCEGDWFPCVNIYKENLVVAQSFLRDALGDEIGKALTERDAKDIARSHNEQRKNDVLIGLAMGAKAICNECKKSKYDLPGPPLRDGANYQHGVLRCVASPVWAKYEEEYAKPVRHWEA